MSPQRVAAAATVSPYPFDIRQERQAQASTTTENADRGPHIKGKKPKPKPRAERNPRQEEEIRFNTGPRNLRAPQASRGGRRGFRMPGRAYLEDRNGIPDYPPPSFQEAMTTPPVSVCSSTTSLPLAPTTLPLVIPENIPEDPREPIHPTAAPVVAEMPPSENELDFERTMYVIDRNSVPVCSTDLPRGKALVERVQSDWLKRRGVEFPGKAPGDSLSLGKSSDRLDAPNRGRLSTRSLAPLLIDADPKTDKGDLPSPVNSAKRRFLSLSPLRTIFPPRSPTHQDRATLSAHPSPSSSPYPTSRSLFFRSSTSLATASFLKLPLLPSPIASKSDLLSRKIFKGKGSRPTHEAEPIENWEVLSEETYAGVDEEGKETAEHPRSLMSAIESIQPRTVGENSPTRTQGFTFGTQIVDLSHGKRPLVVPETAEEERRSLGSPREVQTSTLRDWKGPYSAFIDRPLHRSRPLPSGISEISLNATHFTDNIPHSPPEPLIPVACGPPLTSVRVRATSPSPSPGLRHTAQVAHPSPLRIDAALNNATSQSATEANLYQKALDTPLPITPVFDNHFDKGGSLGSLDSDSEILEEGAPPFVVRSLPVKLTNPISANGLEALCATPSTTLSIATQTTATLATSNPTFKGDSSEEPMTPTRHHYAGRPLPRPPASVSRVAVVDSLYASPESPLPSGEKTGSSYNNCPEGLLIDLNDTSLDNIPGSGTSTPLTDEGRYNSTLHLPIPMSQASSSSVELQTDRPSFAYDSIQRTSTPLLPTSAGSGHFVPQSSALSDLTELDLLVSSLADGQNDGSDYDTLLLVSELIGPANPSTTDTCPKVNPNGNMSLIGRIEVKRRRTTKSGVVKLKLTLLDVAVNKCGICLSQFKDAEVAALTSVCQHSFHEKCLERWLVRSKTCPLCRVPLDTDVR